MPPPITTWFAALQHRLALAFPLAALLLAACAVQTGRPACGEQRLEASNTAALPVEQLYYGAPGAWGEDLLGAAGLEPGAARPVVLPGVPGLALRVVWADGRAVELPGLDPCRNVRIVMTQSTIRVD